MDRIEVRCSRLRVIFTLIFSGLLMSAIYSWHPDVLYYQSFIQLLLCCAIGLYLWFLLKKAKGCQTITLTLNDDGVIYWPHFATGESLATRVSNKSRITSLCIYLDLICVNNTIAIKHFVFKDSVTESGYRALARCVRRSQKVG